MSEHATYPLDRYGLLHRAAALEAGFTDNELAALVRKGLLRRVARGAYVVPVVIDPADRARVAEAAIDEYRRRSIAVLLGSSAHGAAVLSHQSAAAVHGLPMLKPDLSRVHLTNGEMGGGHLLRTTRVHASELRPGEVVDVNGIAVTSLERTVADVAQSTPADSPLAFPRALVVCDAALRLGVLREALALQLNRRRRCGTRAAHRAVAHANGLSESVGESWGRAQMIVAGLPVPTLQVKHVVGGQTYRVDGEWCGLLAWEFDGMSKYFRYRKPGESVADMVLREKRREDALRGAGVMVVRSWWSMLERDTLVPLVSSWLGHFGLR